MKKTHRLLVVLGHLMLLACVIYAFYWPIDIKWMNAVRYFTLVFCVWGVGFNAGTAKGYRMGRDMMAMVWDPVLREMATSMSGKDPGPVIKGTDA